MPPMLLPPIHLTIGYGEIKGEYTLFALSLPSDLIKKDKSIENCQIKIELQGYDLEEMQQILHTSIEFFQLGRASGDAKFANIHVDEMLNILLIEEDPDKFLEFLKNEIKINESFLPAIKENLLSLPFFSKKSKDNGLFNLSDSLNKLSMNLSKRSDKTIDSLLECMEMMPDSLRAKLPKNFLELISDKDKLKSKYRDNPIELLNQFIKLVIEAAPHGAKVFIEKAREAGLTIESELKNMLTDVLGPLDELSDNDKNNANKENEFINQQLIKKFTLNN